MQKKKITERKSHRRMKKSNYGEIFNNDCIEYLEYRWFKHKCIEDFLASELKIIFAIYLLSRLQQDIQFIFKRHDPFSKILVMNPIVCELKKKLSSSVATWRDQSRRSADYIFGKWHVRGDSQGGSHRGVTRGTTKGADRLGRARKSDLPSVSVPVLDICIQIRVIGVSGANASAKVYAPIEITYRSTYHAHDDAIYTAMCRVQKFIRTANKTSNNNRGTSNICSLARTSVKLRGAVKKIITFLFAQYHW